MSTLSKQEGTGFELLGSIVGPRSCSPLIHFLFPNLLFPYFPVIHLPVFKTNGFGKQTSVDNKGEVGSLYAAQR